MEEFLIIEAANGSGNPKVAGLAYGGGKMNLPGWKYPVVVDLAGLEIPEQVPLLANHENKVASRVGMVAAKVVNDTLEIEGDIVAKGDQADDIVAQSKAGADWQLSIGAEVKKSELVKGKRTVNGQEQTGPFYHISESTLREISIIPVGADGGTKLKVAASFNIGEGPKETEAGSVLEKQPEKKITAKEEKTVAAEKKTDPKTEPQPEKTVVADGDVALQAIRAERGRVGKIQAICAGEYAEIERQAISAGWSPEETSQKVLKALRENRPAADVNIIVKRKPQGAEMRKTLEAAMCLRIGIPGDTLLAEYGDDTVHRGDEISDMSIKQLLVECMAMEGVDAPRTFGNETIHAAFSTVSLPGILSYVANKKLLQSYQAQPIIATKLCSSGDLNDFKENERFRLTDAGDLQ
ncbi:MAG: HK97 family phage prohead protease, partial [Victivallaceae bacterium]|nr:HK97 family phage prohead protease [Victivallaceae bacterium]